MIWKNIPPARGDVIRVKMSFYYHYGIYVDDDTVIQFGYPDNTGILPENISVLSTSIEEFACGRFCETGVLEKCDKKKRLSSKETVNRACARLGETGYNILENNCEHFVYSCAFGDKNYFRKTTP